MQQIRYLVAVMDVRRGNARAMDQAGLTVRANVQLHAEVPLVALLGLVHFRVAALLLVLGRGRCGDQRGIDNRAARQLHAVGQQQFAHFGEQRRTQLVLFHQVTKVEQGRRIGRPFAAKIEPAEVSKHGHVVERIFAGFVAQVEPIGHAVHPQHPLHTHRRAPIPGLRVMRLDQRTELGPRHQAIHARQKFRLARRSAVLLEAFHCSQRHLLHRLVPCDHNSLSDSMTKKSFTAFAPYSVFP